MMQSFATSALLRQFYIFKASPQQVQPIAQTPKPKTQKTVVQNPRPVIVKNSSGLGAAFFTVLLLALVAGGYIWYQQKKEHEYLGFKITDKGISVTSDGVKGSSSYSTSSSSQNSSYSAPIDIETRPVSNSASYNNVVTCQIVNARGSVNGRQYCDTLDCDTDSSTATYTIDVGDTVTPTGRSVTSSLPSVGSWVEVDANGTRLFVAGTKLACE